MRSANAANAGFTASDLAVLGLELVLAGAVGFLTCPLAVALPFGGAVVLLDLGGLLASTLSCVLLDEAAVGLIIRSRKLPSAGGGAGFRVVCDERDSGRWLDWSDERGVGFADAGCGLGLVVVDTLPLTVLLLLCEGTGVGSCLARDAAVGAVRREEISAGFVASLALGLAFGECLLEVAAVLSEPAARATELAVGAVRELLLAFFAGSFRVCAFGDSAFVLDGALAEVGVFG